VELDQWQRDSEAKVPIRTLATVHGDARLVYGAGLVQKILKEVFWRERPAELVICRRRGRLWMVELGNRAALVQDSVGLSYLAVLLANPGSEIAAIELAAGSGLADAPPAGGSVQPVLDTRAKQAYQEQLSTLKAEVDEHEANNDLERAERARSERDWLISELAAAAGLAGRLRSFPGNEERARVSVGKAIRRAMNRIEAADPVIGETLRTSIRTGLRCCYQAY
jgi:hypothetical protein